MNDDIKREIVLTSLNAMMRGGHFNICVVRDAAKLLGVSTSSEAMATLHLLHCVDWKAMSPSIRKAVPDLIREALGTAAPQFYDTPQPAMTPLLAVSHRPSIWQRLGVTS